MVWVAGVCCWNKLHAEYDATDEHKAHRAVQGLQLSQFIRHTSDGCDLVIVGGDFNFRPDQLGYRLIRHGSNLEDAWISRVRTEHYEILAAASTHPPSNVDADCLMCH